MVGASCVEVHHDHGPQQCHDAYAWVHTILPFTFLFWCCCPAPAKISGKGIMLQRQDLLALLMLDQSMEVVEFTSL